MKAFGFLNFDREDILVQVAVESPKFLKFITGTFFGGLVKFGMSRFLEFGTYF